MITITVDSDDEEAAVRGALAGAGLSFTIRRGQVYQGGGGSGAWALAVPAGGGCVGFGGSGGGAVGFGGVNTAGPALRPCCQTEPGTGHRKGCTETGG